MDEIIMEAKPGEHIETFAARMVVWAWQYACTVLGSHDQFTLVARPGMTRNDIIADWDKQYRDYDPELAFAGRARKNHSAF